MSWAATAGFVGLGNIGGPMAARLAERGAEQGLRVLGYDVSPEALVGLERSGGTAAASVAELAAAARVVCVMVRDDAQVREVLDAVLSAAREGTVVAVHSTIAPDTPAALAEAAASYGVDVVDAPVSGGAVGAAEGRLAIMVGGSAAAYEAVRPVLALLGDKLVHAGPIGAGTRMKLARNLLHFAAFTAVTEAQRLAEAAGLNLIEFGEVVRHTDAITGGPGAIMYRDTTAPLQPDGFWWGVFEHVRLLGEKDLQFALALADELGVDAPLARLALTRLGPGLGLPAHPEERR